MGPLKCTYLSTLDRAVFFRKILSHFVQTCNVVVSGNVYRSVITATPRSSPLSETHHRVKLNFILIHLSGYGGVHPQDEQIIQPTGSIILIQIKKFYEIINTQCKDGPGYLDLNQHMITQSLGPLLQTMWIAVTVMEQNCISP